MADKIPVSEQPEFIGQFIDIFEDFLEEKGVFIENDEKDEAYFKGADRENICNIYGTDYGNLSDAIKELLVNWGILETEGEA